MESIVTLETKKWISANMKEFHIYCDNSLQMIIMNGLKNSGSALKGTQSKTKEM